MKRQALKRPPAKNHTPRVQADYLLAHAIQGGEATAWRRMLTSADDNVVLRALMYLTDRRDGRAVQNIKMEGEVNHGVQVVFTGSAPPWLKAEPVRQLAAAGAEPDDIVDALEPDGEDH